MYFVFRRKRHPARKAERRNDDEVLRCNCAQAIPIPSRVIALSEKFVREAARKAGLGLVFVWFFAGGVAHFLYTDVFTSVVPLYVPYPREVVLFTGVCEIAGALGLLSKRLRPWAGLALMLFAVCVLPVHVEMLKHAERYSHIGEPLLWVRLFLQPVLIWVIFAVTRSPRRLFSHGLERKLQ